MDEKKDTKRKFSRTLEVKREKFLAFLKRTVGDIIVLNENRVKDMPKGNMMVCCTHRSHLDYVILGLKIPEFGASQIRFAAGDNLTRLPVLGKLFRSVGAFSVYRGKSSQRSYVMQLANQVKMMVSNGDSVIVFPEAGRSYSGAMLEVRSGVLSAGVLAKKENPNVPIYYLPCAINYSKIPDLRAFDMLLAGKSRRDGAKNSVDKFIGAFMYYFADVKVFLGSWILKQRTDVYMNVAEATSLDKITDVEAKFRADTKSPLVANRESIAECSAWLEKQFYAIFPILPMNLVAYIFKNMGRKGLTESEIQILLKKVKEAGLCLSAVENLSPQEILKNGIKQLAQNGATGGFYHVRQRRKNRLDYFAAFLESAFKFLGIEDKNKGEDKK